MTAGTERPDYLDDFLCDKKVPTVSVVALPENMKPFPTRRIWRPCYRYAYITTVTDIMPLGRWSTTF